MTYDNDNNELTLDLRDILRIVKKWRLWIVMITIEVTIVAAIISFLTPPTYQAVAKLRIKDPKSGLADSLFSDVSLMSTTYMDQLAATYAEIMKSRTVLESVIQQTQAGKEKVPTYEGMLNRITIEPVKNTQILNVMAGAPNPEEAKRVANTLVGAFLARLTYLNRSDQAEISDFIGARLRESQKNLLSAEQHLESYKKTAKILSPDEETKAMVDRFAQIDQLAAENKLNIATSRARLDNVQAQLTTENKGLVADSPLIQQCNSKLAELEIQLVGLLEKYSNKHPDVLAVRAQIGETRKKLNAEINRVVNNEAPSLNPLHQNLLLTKLQSEAEIKAARAQAVAIRRIQADHEAEIEKLPAKEQELTRLMRDTSVNQEIYVMLAKRYEEAKISTVMQPTDVQIVDEAVAPDKPVKPNKRMNILIGAFLGLFTGTGLVFMLEYFNKTIDTAEDVRNYLELPVLGSIPDFDIAESVKADVSKRSKADSRSKQKLET